MEQKYGFDIDYISRKTKYPPELIEEYLVQRQKLYVKKGINVNQLCLEMRISSEMGIRIERAIKSLNFYKRITRIIRLFLSG